MTKDRPLLHGAGISLKFTYYSRNLYTKIIVLAISRMGRVVRTYHTFGAATGTALSQRRDSIATMVEQPRNK
jgi:hypothetical protein